MLFEPELKSIAAPRQRQVSLAAADFLGYWSEIVTGFACLRLFSRSRALTTTGVAGFAGAVVGYQNIELCEADKIWRHSGEGYRGVDAADSDLNVLSHTVGRIAIRVCDATEPGAEQNQEKLISGAPDDWRGNESPEPGVEAKQRLKRCRPLALTRSSTPAGGPLPVAFAVKMLGATLDTLIAPCETICPLFMTTTFADPEGMLDGTR